MKLRTRQPGAALMLVLIVLSVTVLLSTAYLSSAAMYQAGSSGFGDLARARFLAESGAQHGIYLLREHPLLLNGADVTPLGPYTADNLGGNYTIRVTPTGLSGEYRIEARGTYGRGTHTCTVVARRGPQAPPLQIQHGLFLEAASTIIVSGIRVYGPTHVNGYLYNWGRLYGDTRATGYVWNFGVISPSPRSFVSAETIPNITPSSYYEYVYQNQRGQAAFTTDTSATSSDWYSNGRADTSGNPAGVLVVRPSNSSKRITINSNFRFTGTMIVEGNVRLDGTGIEFTAPAGFPALVVTGSLTVRNGARADFDGVVHVKKGVLTSGNTGSSRLNVDGALVCVETGISSALDGTHTITYNAAKACLVPPGGDSLPPVEIVRWDD